MSIIGLTCVPPTRNRPSNSQGPVSWSKHKTIGHSIIPIEKSCLRLHLKRKSTRRASLISERPRRESIKGSDEPLATAEPVQGGGGPGRPVALREFADSVPGSEPEGHHHALSSWRRRFTEVPRRHFMSRLFIFGSVGIKQTRHAIPAGLLADLAHLIASVIIMPGGIVAAALGALLTLDALHARDYRALHQLTRQRASL
jgi:hypothetical protein